MRWSQHEVGAGGIDLFLGPYVDRAVASATNDTSTWRRHQKNGLIDVERVGEFANINVNRVDY